MDFFGLNTLFILVLFVPGYVFIYVHDYFLCKREKSQFEKTVQGFAASVVLIVVSIIFFAFIDKFGMAIEKMCNDISKLQLTAEGIFAFFRSHICFFCVYFLILCVAAATVGIAYGKIVMENGHTFLGWLTNPKRNYFQDTQLAFYHDSISNEKMEKSADIFTKRGDHFVGFIVVAPGNEKDKYIIIENPHRIIKDTNTKKYKDIPLAKKKMLLKTSDIYRINV